MNIGFLIRWSLVRPAVEAARNLELHGIVVTLFLELREFAQRNPNPSLRRLSSNNRCPGIT